MRYCQLVTQPLDCYRFTTPMRLTRFNSLADWTSALLLSLVLIALGPVLLAQLVYLSGVADFGISISVYRFIIYFTSFAVVVFAVMHGLATLGAVRLLVFFVFLFVIGYFSVLFDFVREFRYFSILECLMWLTYSYAGFITARVLFRAQATPGPWACGLLALAGALIVIFPGLLLHLISLYSYSSQQIQAINIPSPIARLHDDAARFATLFVAFLFYFLACERLLPLPAPSNPSANRSLWRQAVTYFLFLNIAAVVFQTENYS